MGDSTMVACMCSCCCLPLMLFVSIVMFFLIVQPKNIEIGLIDASLREFQYFNATNNNTLSYNLAFKVTLRNPNKRAGVHFDRFKVVAIYGKREFANATFSPFYQGHKNSTTVNVELKGIKTSAFEKKERDTYNKEMGDGIYSIHLKFPFKVRARYSPSLKPKFKPKPRCKLSMRVSPKDTSRYSAYCSSIDIFAVKMGFAIGPLDLEIS